MLGVVFRCLSWGKTDTQGSAPDPPLQGPGPSWVTLPPPPRRLSMANLTASGTPTQPQVLTVGSPPGDSPQGGDCSQVL